MGFFKRKKNLKAKEAKYSDYFNDKEIEENSGDVEWIVDSLVREVKRKTKDVENLEAGPYGSQSLAESVEKTNKFLNSIRLNNQSTDKERIQLSLQAELAIKNNELEKAKIDREIANIKYETLLNEEKSSLALIELQTTKLEANYKLLKAAEKVMESVGEESKKELEEVINATKENIVRIKAKAETTMANKLPDEYQKIEDEKERLKREVAARRAFDEKENEVSLDENTEIEKGSERKSVNLQKIRRKEIVGKANLRTTMIKDNRGEKDKRKDDYEKSI